MKYTEQRQITWTELSDRYNITPHVLMMYDIGLQEDDKILTIKTSAGTIFINVADFDEVDENDDVYIIRTKQRVHIHLSKVTPEINIHIL